MRAQPTAKNAAVVHKKENRAKNERENGQKNAGNELQGELRGGNFLGGECVNADRPFHSQNIKLRRVRVQTE